MPEQKHQTNVIQNQCDTPEADTEDNPINLKGLHNLHKVSYIEQSKSQEHKYNRKNN